MDEATALALFGTTEARPAVTRLQAGALEAEFCEGQLRAVRWHGVEVVRGLAYLLRDSDWGTVPAEIGAVQHHADAQGFELLFPLHFQAGEARLTAHARLQGRCAGPEAAQLHFEVHAQPDAALRSNRCGFVVLHPAAAAGLPLHIEHGDGRVTESRFPREISPGQPALGIRALRYAPAPGLTLALRLQAELPHDRQACFEMEDQRNWSDASFKTYVGSLHDPWPYTLAAGQKLRQSVGLELGGTAVAGPAARQAAATAASANTAATPTAVSTATATTAPRVALAPLAGRRMPALGVGVPPGLARAGPAERQALLDLGAQWWLVEADLRDPGLAADLACLAALRTTLPLPAPSQPQPQPQPQPQTQTQLQVRVRVRVQLDIIAPADDSPEAAAARAAACCREAGLAVQAVRLLPAPYLLSHQPAGPWPALPALARYASAAREHFPQAAVGGGMYTSFTELNRLHAAREGLDFIGHLTCPTVHAADDEAVMQTHEALAHIVHSVQQLWPGLAYRLGPSALAPRRNPYGRGTAPNPGARRLALAERDPRHGAAFGAAWVAGYAAATGCRGLEVLALLDSHGPSGPLAGEARIPAWAVLQRLAAAAGAAFVELQHLGPGLAGLAWQHPGQPVQGCIAHLRPGVAHVRLAEALQFDGGPPQNEVQLGPYAVGCFTQPARGAP